MKLWQDLLGTEVGLMSFAVIVGVLVIGAVIGVINRGKMNEPPAG